jgi:hypothetical protein
MEAQLKAALFAVKNILDAAEGKTRLSELDAVSVDILNCVATRATLGIPTSVGELTSLTKSSASHVTILKRLQVLTDLQWIEIRPSAQHHRRMNLQLTGMAIGEINAASEIVLKALSSEFTLNT